MCKARCTEAHYATRRQLRAAGLRPGGQDVAAVLERPMRPMTPGRWAALDAANAARRLCPDCGRDAGYVIPTTLGTCVPCAYPPLVGVEGSC
ncbi:RRQRL motif-containing zinc-binding protein [Streptomyces olivaceus]